MTTNPVETAATTPTQDLILEVLAARHRLGERLWPFHTRTQRAAEALQADGLVNVMHGNVPHTYRASLTDAGRAHVLDGSYETPSQRRVKELEAEREVLWARVLELQQAVSL